MIKRLPNLEMVRKKPEGGYCHRIQYRQKQWDIEESGPPKQWQVPCGEVGTEWKGAGEAAW